MNKEPNSLRRQRECAIASLNRGGGEKATQKIKRDFFAGLVHLILKIFR